MTVDVPEKGTAERLDLLVKLMQQRIAAIDADLKRGGDVEQAATLSKERINLGNYLVWLESCTKAARAMEHRLELIAGMLTIVL